MAIAPLCGGTSLAPNCGYVAQQQTGPIQPVSWWTAKWGDGTADKNFFLNDSTGNGQTKDSWPMYQLALGIDGNTSLYRASGDTKFLDRSLLYIENCISRAVVSNNTNFPLSQYKDGYLGWIDLSHPTNTHGLEQALYEFYWGRYVMQTIFYARNQAGYTARIASILSFMETNIWAKWYSRGTGQNQLYRNVIDMCSHTAIVALYLRDMAVSSTIRTQCQTVLDNIDHNGMTLYTKNSVEANFHNQLNVHQSNPNAYLYNRFWPSENQTELWGSDQPHGDAFITYVIAAIDQGYSDWSQTDLDKLINLADIIWPNQPTFYNWQLGPAGNSGERNEGNYNDGLLKLGGFDEAFQLRVETHTGAATGSLTGTQYFGCGALNAARLLAVGAEGAPLLSNRYGSILYNRYANRGETNVVHTIPDFSFAGYGGGGVPIPDVPTKSTLSPGALADDAPRIQSAINAVAAMPLVDGYRGAVVLNAGEYRISNPIHIGTGGVVLRGAGQGTGGTVIIADQAKVYDAITVGAGNGWTETGTRQDISDSFVPVGARSFIIAASTGFVVGDQIAVVRTPNDAWLAAIHGDVRGWTLAEMTIRHARKITGINGRTITIDIPIVDTIEDLYGGGYVVKTTNAARIDHVGIENLSIESSFASATDENHAHTAISIAHINNSWVRRVTTKYFWWGGVNIQDEASWLTIEDVATLDPKSVITGGRRYAFNVSGGINILFQRCYCRSSRHAFVTGARGTGPIVWLDCLATDNISVTGPHQKWSTGLLFDNTKAIATTGAGSDFPGWLNVELRAGLNNPAAAFHGWAGAQNLFWNCTHPHFVCDAPMGAMNWCIGCIGVREESQQTPSEPFGWFESIGTNVSPRSIYIQQLKDRLGQEAVDNVIHPAQLSGKIWDAMAVWAGNGRLFGTGTVRDRPIVSNGTLKTDTMTLLRGCTMDLRTQATPVSSNDTFWKTLRSNGINVVRYDVKTTIGGRTVANQLPFIDTAVNLAEANHAYIMIMNSVVPGGYDKAALTDFWTQVSPRYKDRTCVIYEITNEPTANASSSYWGDAASWNSTVLRDFRDIFNIIRNAAPSSPVVILSSANLYPNAAAYITILQNFSALSGPAIDWSNTIVGYHHYLGTYNFGGTDGFGGLNTLKASYPIIMTECNDFMGQPGDNDPRNKTAVWLEYEQNGISWVNLDGKGGNINTQITNEILPFLASHGYPVPVE